MSSGYLANKTTYTRRPKTRHLHHHDQRQSCKTILKKKIINREIECELINKAQRGIYKTLNEFNITGTRGVIYNYTHINKIKVKIIISCIQNLIIRLWFYIFFLKHFSRVGLPSQARMARTRQDSTSVFPKRVYVYIYIFEKYYYISSIYI